MFENNLLPLWPIAQEGFEKYGRGAVVAGTGVSIEEGNVRVSFPAVCVYLRARELPKWKLVEAIRKVKEYDPASEFVAVALKPKGPLTYRVRVNGSKEELVRRG